jgi:16S rRNA (uracil1498-N3)-methyltransferase
VFVTDLANPALRDADHHHLERVLRLRVGESVTVSDGAGQWRRCRFGAGGVLVLTGDVEVVPRAEPGVTVAFALTKGDRPEWTVQKLVEVGVDRIIPMTTARTVVRWDVDRAPRQVARLRAVALAAAMQSRQAWLPEVDDLRTFASMVAGEGVALAHIDGARPNLGCPTVLVGPEGGWDEGELASDRPRVTLGPTVLRAETAAVAAGLLLCALRAGVVR